MISYINVVTLPQICFEAVPLDYISDEKNLTINKFIIDANEEIKNLKNCIKEDVENIIKDSTKTLYVNLDIRKYLMVDAKLISGKVQALNADYYIFSKKDKEYYCIKKIKDILNLNFLDEFYKTAEQMLLNAIDFDLVSEDDYVKMTYKSSYRKGYYSTSSAWNSSANQVKTNNIFLNAMCVPANKKVIALTEVLNYSKNRKITVDESNKIKLLLSQPDTEKIALTLLNTINPNFSFIELYCLINSMSSDIKKRNPNVPILPLLKGAYDFSLNSHKADYIVDKYESLFGHASNEILERIADNYYHPKLEKSSVFDFKLKLKKK